MCNLNNEKLILGLRHTKSIEDVHDWCLSAADRIEEQEIEILELNNQLYKRDKTIRNIVRDTGNMQ